MIELPETELEQELNQFRKDIWAMAVARGLSERKAWTGCMMFLRTIAFKSSRSAFMREVGETFDSIRAAKTEKKN